MQKRPKTSDTSKRSLGLLPDFSRSMLGLWIVEGTILQVSHIRRLDYPQHHGSGKRGDSMTKMKMATCQIRGTAQNSIMAFLMESHRILEGSGQCSGTPPPNHHLPSLFPWTTPTSPGSFASRLAQTINFKGSDLDLWSIRLPGTRHYHRSVREWHVVKYTGKAGATRLPGHTLKYLPY